MNNPEQTWKDRALAAESRADSWVTKWVACTVEKRRAIAKAQLDRDDALVAAHVREVELKRRLELMETELRTLVVALDNARRSAATVS